MPKVWERSENDYSILVWDSTEPMQELLQMASLNEEDTSKLNAFISQSRKREWLTVRNSLKLLLSGKPHSKITYDSNGKPGLENMSISISHSQNRIAIMVSENERIGIDIEQIGNRIEYLTKKFLSESEDHSACIPKRIEKLHVMWGAKEVLFKIHGIGNMEFKRELLVYPFSYANDGIIKASILKIGFEEDFNIHYLKTGNFMLVWSIKKAENI